MKKLTSVFLLVLIFALSGCGNKSDYEQMVDELGNVNSMRYGMFEAGASIEGVNFDLTMKIDSKEELVYMSLFGVDVYVDADKGYMNMLGNWFSVELSDEDKAEFEEEFDFAFLELDMPKGSDTITVATGYENIDNALNGKTYDDVIVATDDGYTIIGLEDSVTITVEDNILTLTLSDAEEGIDGHISIGKSEAFELPAEAEEALAVPAEALAAIE